MDETNPTNQGEGGGQKLEKLEHELEEIERKAEQPAVPAPQTQVQPTQPAPSEPASPSPPVETTPPPTGKSRIVLWAGLGFLFLALVAAGAYYVGSRKTAPAPVLEPPLTETPTSTPDLTADWEIYVTPDKKYQIKHPTEWLVAASPPEEWGQKVGVPEFSLAKSGYQIVFSFPFAFGPDVCIFPDHPDYTKSFPDNPILEESKCSDNYVEIIGKDSTYRRIIFENPANANQLTWNIYTKDDKGNFATLPPISYYTPLNPDESILNEMDQILSTFKFIDSESSTEGQSCGGLAGVPCPEGYGCKLEGNYPDASGVCVKRVEK